MLRRIARMKPAPIPIAPKVTPHPDAAAALERRRKNLEYSPADGFLVDKPQQRKPTP